MGKRKAKKAPPKKKQRTVATVFDCPFCNHKSVITCKMDRANFTGTLSCRVCTAKFETKIESIHEPIDVYSEWVDQCALLEQTEDV
mmetsp:Transcript_9764/g.16451  ORF Transcript_9764/g.16451 Transcript_9764/m.16451 type:complete len:86 (-) Transcript_9764:140-397(-)